MSETQIMKFLSKQPDEWFTTKEISKAIGVKQSSTNKALESLIRFKFIIGKGKPHYSYNQIIYKIKKENVVHTRQIKKKID